MPDTPITSWTKVPKGAAAYVDWWWTARGREDVYHQDGGTALTLGDTPFHSVDFSDGQPEIDEGASGSETPSQANSVSASFYGGGQFVPLPSTMINDGWPQVTEWISDDLLARLPEAEDIPEDAVIVGVIDTGVPLNHHRTRCLKDGVTRTRIVSAWQQSADRSRDEAAAHSGGNELLPFGLELTGPEIDQLIADLSQNGPLDEDAFNRAAQLTDPGNPFGQRDLDFRASHGAHILDLASGYDPHDPVTADLSERARLVVVNFPTQALHGSAGHFLQYFACYAVERVRAMSFALYAKKHGLDLRKDPVKGFPTFINLSYGMQAGPKDGYMPFENAVRKLIRRRGQPLPKQGGAKKPELIAPLRLAMPVGNNNLERSTARLELPKGSVRWIDWRISPEDQTANFVEIWTDAVPSGANAPKPSDFELILQAPDGAEFHFSDLPQVGATAGSARYAHKAKVGASADDPRGYGRVYATLKSFTSRASGSSAVVERTRLNFLVALRPPLDYTPPVFTDDEAEIAPLSPAPAGLWRIGVLSKDQKIGVDIHVQSDQPFEIQSRISRASYFDDHLYRKYAPDGHTQDSFSYDRVHGGPAEYLETGQGPVRRAGSTNAMGSSRYVRVFSGYRENDGRPVPLTATARLEPDFNDERRGADAAFPIDDGSAHYGILGSGSKDGSSIAFRGASMATALSTRYIVEAVLKSEGEDIEDRQSYGRGWVHAQAETAEAQHNTYAPAARAKIGAGRLPYPDTYRSHRPARLGAFPENTEAD